MPLQFQTAIDPSYSPVLYTPDYSFLKYLLDKKTERYQQGLSAVSSAYASLQKDLTDPANIQRRDQYLKNAESQLQKVAGSDLSLQENVNAAQTIFDPVATDKAIIYDSYHTARVKKELAQMESWRDSEDMEQRKKFNPQIYNWVQKDLESIKNGQGNVNNYKVENRNAFAYVDAQDLINKAVKDYGFEVKQDIDGGYYVYNVSGGPKFKQNYKLFAEQVLAANPVYQQQKSILGKSTHESVLDQAKQSGIEPTTFLKNYATTDYDRYRDTRKKYVTDIKTDIETRKKELIAERNSIDTTTPEGQQKLQENTENVLKLQEDYTQYQDLQKDYTKTFGQTDKEYEGKRDAYVQNFMADPAKFFGEQYQTQDVDRFSNIRSASINTSINPNTAYFNAFTAADNARKTTNTILNSINKTDIAEHAENRKQEELDWKEAGKPVTIEGETVVSSTYDPTTGQTTTTKTKGQAPLTYIGASSTDLNKTVTNINAFRSKLDLSVSKAKSFLGDSSNGGAISILHSMGVKPENVSVIRQYLLNVENQRYTDPDKKYIANKEEVGALHDMYSSLMAFAKNTNDQATLDKLNEISKNNTLISNVDYTGLMDIAISNYKFKDPKDLQYVREFQDYKKAHDDIKFLSNGLNAAKKAVISHYSNPQDFPEFQSLFIKKDGKATDLINSDYIYNQLKNVKQVFVAGTGFFTDDLVAFDDQTKRKIADGYINGTLNVNVEPGHISKSADAQWIRGKVSMEVDGKKLYFELGETTNPVFPMSSKKYTKLIDRINADVTIPTYTDKDMSENYFASPIWAVGGSLKNNIVTALSESTQFSSYLMQQNAQYGYSPVANPELEDQVRKALKDPDKNIAKDGVRIYSKSASNGGGMSVAVTFRQPTKDEKAEYLGQTYYFPINIGKGTPDVIQSFSTVDDETQYDRMKNSGKMFDLFNFEKMGVKVQMLPYTKGSSKGSLHIFTQKQDQITKEFSGPLVEQIGEYNMEGMTGRELEDKIFNQVVNPYLTNRIQFENQKATQTTTGGTVQGGVDAMRILSNINL